MIELIVIYGIIGLMIISLILKCICKDEPIGRELQTINAYIERCPFCGAEAQVFSEFAGCVIKGYFVSCKQCGITQTNTSATKKLAIDKWNERKEVDKV